MLEKFLGVTNNLNSSDCSHYGEGDRDDEGRNHRYDKSGESSVPPLIKELLENGVEED